MELKPKIPRPTGKRLSLYLRELGAHVAAERATVSSKQLGSVLGLTDAQVRKDLAYFGQFGHPGVGYSVPLLHSHLIKILGLDRSWSAALVGTGNIGRALLSYRRFEEHNFFISAVFDRDSSCIGQTIEGRVVYPMDDLDRVIREGSIRLGIVAVPADVAQEVADRLSDAGVTGILNFAPRRLDVHKDVSVSSVDFTLALEQLAFQVSLGLTGSLDDDA